MYQKYQTESIVLSSRERGEADRVFALYTKDFGLVWARASGVRREESKMRYALQQYAHVHIGLVRGKRGWRLAGATAARQLSGSAAGAPTFARIAQLILRLVHGEEQNQFLFDTLALSHAALAESASHAVPLIELAAVARVLYALGYLSSKAAGAALFAQTELSFIALDEVEAQREALLREINKAIAETQL